MTTLSDLIARLEAAKEGSRALDYEIWYSTEPNSHAPIHHNRNAKTYSGLSYTTSLDAALTLVPEGYEQNWDLKWRNGAVCRAELYRPSYQTDALAATPALALCIAALRAREARR